MQPSIFHQALREVNDTEMLNMKQRENIQFFLERLYMTRISVLNLINHHQKLSINEMYTPTSVGNVDTDLDLMDTVNVMFDNASAVCEKKYQRIPGKNETYRSMRPTPQ